MNSRSSSPPSNIDFPQSPPPTSPLSKRQEQNRAAQRAFRERRARLLKEMDERITGLEEETDLLKFQVRRMTEIDRQVSFLSESFHKLEETVNDLALAPPLWTVPASESKVVPEPRAVIGALRPSSTDPTLDSSEQ